MNQEQLNKLEENLKGFPEEDKAEYWDTLNKDYNEGCATDAWNGEHNTMILNQTFIYHHQMHITS
jgi:uncharacterized membrane protein